MVDLNYEASVPIEERAPFVVNVSSPNPPGDKFQDYVPKNQVNKTKPNEAVQLKDSMTPPMHYHSEDFVSNSDVKKTQEKDKSNIQAIAKKIFTDRRNRKEDYLAALKVLKNRTKQELEFPSEEVARALRVVKKSKPLTKEEAIKRATEQFYGHTT